MSEKLRCHFCKREVPPEIVKRIRYYEQFYGPVAMVVCEDCMKKIQNAKYN